MKSLKAKIVQAWFIVLPDLTVGRFRLVVGGVLRLE